MIGTNRKVKTNILLELDGSMVSMSSFLNLITELWLRRGMSSVLVGSIYTRRVTVSATMHMAQGEKHIATLLIHSFSMCEFACLLRLNKETHCLLVFALILGISILFTVYLVLRFVLFVDVIVENGRSAV